MNYIRIEKLKWHSRRSILELDLFFDRFITNGKLDGLSANELDLYENLLEYEDSDIMALFLKQKTEQNDQMQKLINLIIAK